MIISEPVDVLPSLAIATGKEQEEDIVSFLHFNT
jgi:hypothetical protein